MPEEFAPEWEYFVGDSEITELLEEIIEYHSKRINRFPTEELPNGRLCLRGIICRHPNRPHTFLGKERPIREGRNAIQCQYQECRKLFNATTRHTRFCSVSCARIANNHLYTRPLFQKLCICGTTFETRRSRRVYCSQECSLKYNTHCIRQLEEFISCANCSVAFRPESNRRKYCSLKCGTANNGGKNKLKNIECSWCKKVFKPSRSIYNKFCSRRCSAFNRWAKRA